MSVLAFEPENVIYIGFEEIMTEKRKNDLEKFFKLKSINTRVSFKTVSNNSYENIKSVIRDLISENDDCILDITGGNEIILSAMGCICETHKIPTIQFDISSGNLIKIDNCDNLPVPKRVSLSIEEHITLNGGAIINELSNKHDKLTSDFIKDIKTAWKIRTQFPDKWNDSITALRILENLSANNGGAYQEIYTDNDEVSMQLTKIKHFNDSGLISIKKSDNCITIKYKSNQVYHLLLKIGNVFEYYTFSNIQEILGAQSDNIIRMGVFLDWDGIIHPYYSPEIDTVNEVDILIAKETYPIFISCKSGDLKKEALYEITTVANRFGGKHAKKIVVATHIKHSSASKDAILQRAKDMNISVIYDTDIISEEKFKELLKRKI